MSPSRGNRSEMTYHVASVPFLNAKPLVWALERWPDRFSVEVGYALPSQLPPELESGRAQAILVSSIDALSVPGRRIAGGCSISTHGRVMSVRLFSQVPFSEIETLALDSSSMTSNALAQIVLHEMFACRPTVDLAPPDGQAMLAEHDACVLIGDKGLVFDGRGLFELDLGEAWFQLTGLPFVWACWVGSDDLSPDLVERLVAARREAEGNLAVIASEAPDTVPAQLAHDYLTTVFDYSLGEVQLAALGEFARRLDALGLAAGARVPDLVGSAAQAAGVR